MTTRRSTLVWDFAPILPDKDKDLSAWRQLSLLSCGNTLPLPCARPWPVGTSVLFACASTPVSAKWEGLTARGMNRRNMWCLCGKANKQPKRAAVDNEQHRITISELIPVATAPHAS